MRTTKMTQGTEAAARRAYRMRRRAQHVEDTRQRITEAAMKLHTSVGPSRASIAAIAEEAGVTRLTVYRHFSDAEQIFAACMGHWATLHPGPDIEAWRSIPDLAERARYALADLYRWYGDAGYQLLPVRRDLELVPPDARARIEAASEERVDAIAGPDGDPAAPAGRRVRAIAAHLSRLETWHSLVADQGLNTHEAVELGTAWLLAGAAENSTKAAGRRSPVRRRRTG